MPRLLARGAALISVTLFLGAVRWTSNTAIAGAGRGLAPSSAIILAQADEEVSSEQIDKYVAVYRSMQRNHSLSVEQAAAAQGLSLRAFREIEDRIERNDVARDEARRALAAGTDQSKNRQPAPAPTTPR
jgi:hypothetical protein